MQSFGDIAIADLQVFPRDAEDVIPYDFIKTFLVYYQQYFDF